MKIATLDLIIILLYLSATVVIGLLLRKQASKSKANYLLGGNKMPWYLLGLSNASGMFDISGTVWLVMLMFVYGLKSIWIPWLWPVFNQIFLMIFLSIWLRRSGVTTGAEWLATRFSGRGAAQSHAVIVIFAIILGLGYLAYGFIGIGKFIEIFIPWDAVSGYIPFHIPLEYVPHFYGICFTLFAIFYSLIGGMLSIVWADVIQYSLMAISGVIIGIIAMKAVASNALNVPDGWMNPFFGTRLHLDWSQIIPEVNEKISSDGYSLFSIFFTMMLLKGIMVSMAGPAPTYDMQKILSTRSPREAALMSGSVSLILMPFRYFMIAGFAVLAIIFYNQLDLKSGGNIDFEQILPAAISQFVPVGLMGILLAGLIAAFMGTFAGTLNATQAYIVNDIYLKFINPKADNNKIKLISWVSGLGMVLLSFVLGFFARDVNDILQWIVSAAYGSYVVSNVLKWYWWRFNGTGFFWGMVGGLVPALTFRFIFPGVLDLYTFPLMLLLALTGALIGTFMTPPTDENILKAFYKNVRPWGFWKPIHDKVVAEDPGFQGNKDFKKDIFNVLIGIIWQTCLVVFPIYLVLLKMVPFAISLLIVLICSLILKKTWFDKLPKD
ncbi:MAG: sodium:solute symporter family protein [Saprospiraceae bacterium]|nr:sodium:solute symporter family protein [Saprospiraceae bacterium]